VELWSAWIRRRLGIEDRIEGLVVDLDELGGVAGELARGCGDGDDRFPDVAHASDGKGVVLQVAAWGRRDLEERIGLRRHLLTDQRAVDAVELQCLRDVDPADRRMRVGGANVVDVGHSVALDVVHEDALALDETLVLLTRDVDADEPGRRLLFFDADRLVGGNRGLAHRPPPFAAEAMASTIFT